MGFPHRLFGEDETANLPSNLFPVQREEKFLGKKHVADRTAMLISILCPGRNR